MRKNNFKEQFETALLNVETLLMDKIEHPEVAELFQRKKDFDCEVYSILERIDFKERCGNLV